MGESECEMCFESCKNDKISDTENPPPSFMPSADEKRVRFSKAQIYYFTRQQGHSSVPQRGGCSLGMAQTHFYSETHNALHYRRIRRMEEKLISNSYSTQSYSRGRRRKLNPRRMPLVPVEDSFNPGDDRRVPVFYSPPHLSPQHEEVNNSDVLTSIVGGTPPPPCLSPPKEPFSPESDPIFSLEADSEASFETHPFATRAEKKLLPLNPNVRTRLLRQAGKSILFLFYTPFCGNLYDEFIFPL